MANTGIHRHKAKQRPHARALHARHSDTELTAQPRAISDTFDTETSTESGLSLDVDDLGAHFLSEATQQGSGNSARRGVDMELSLSGANFEPNNTQWEQIVDLQLLNPARERSTEAPPEQTGRHTRSHVSGSLGAQTEPSTRNAPAADGGGAHDPRGSVMRRAASALRYLADWLERVPSGLN
jgi:hypothetical protein